MSPKNKTAVGMRRRSNRYLKWSDFCGYDLFFVINICLENVQSCLSMACEVPYFFVSILEQISKKDNISFLDICSKIFVWLRTYI